ncbi:reverse transcriptase domain-containing protein [Tanacetum coccineum]
MERHNGDRFDKLPPGSIDNWGACKRSSLIDSACLKHVLRTQRRFQIIRRANETLPDFKERWVSESNAIPSVPELMQISSFMSSHKCPELSKRFSDSIPKTVDEMLKRVDDYVRSEEAFRDIDLPRGKFQRREGSSPWVQKNDRPQKNLYGNARRRVVLTLEPLVSTLKEILATEHQLHLPQPPPLVGVPSKENLNKYCDYHNEKGHGTNDCFHLKRKLEIALESGKLNHLVRDVRQKGKGGQKGNGPQKGKIINMVNCVADNRKRKSRMTNEDWMNVSIVFPLVRSRDLSEEAIMVEAEIEGYSVRWIHVDEGASIEIMYEHCFNMLHPAIKSRLTETHTIVSGFSREQKSWEEVGDRAVGTSKAAREYRLNGGGIGQSAYPDHLVTIGKNLSPEGSTQLKNLLKNNKDVFAWEPSDMTGVQMAEEDEEKTAFYTDQGTFCYTKIPFGFKNTGETYQRLVDEAFQSQIGQNLETYVDDMVVKSKFEQEMIADVAETFDNLKRINMKLNPKKCLFEVEEGKFLGYLVTSEGIRENPAKTKDIAEIQSPKTWGQMQSLSGKLAALNRFLSRTQENDSKIAISNNTVAQRSVVRLPSDIQGGVQCSTNGGEEGKAMSVTIWYREPPHTRLTTRRIAKKSGYSTPMGLQALKAQGAGLVLISPTKTEYAYALRLNFTSTNNQAEYEALLAGLKIAKNMKVQSLNVDSKLVASQINDSYVACQESMIKYLSKAKEYIKCFKSFRIKNIAGNQNQKADVLRKLASVAFNYLTKEILVKVLDVLSTERQEINTVVEEEGDNWMTPIIKCLNEGKWSKDLNEARALRMKINQYVMEEGVLFKRSYLMPLLRCVGPLQANYIIREIHMGACSMHLKPRAVVAKAIRQGYYWPTMHQDAREEIRKCDSCQIHAPVPKLPKTLMTSIMAPWPFFQWGMDVLGPLPEAPRKQINIAVAHPHANGLVERANRSLMEGIKTRLGRERKGWMDELPNVLWAHRTSLKTSNGETSYSLTFGSEAVIPAEIGMPTHRTMTVKEGTLNEEEIRLNLDLLQERREAAAIREARYKMKMEHYYNKRVCPVSFKVGEYVYRRNEASRVENLGKLGPKWEGPYLVTEAYQNGSYKLETMTGREVPRTWNAINLRRCYL